MQSNEPTIHNWVELQNQLFQGSWQPGLNRFRSPFAFRGLDGLSRWLRRY
jgi:hypothetical protein